MTSTSHHASFPFDLRARAVAAMRDNGFITDFPPEAQRQLHALPAPTAANGRRDLRGLLWSSIDNDTSRDLDQIEVVQSEADGTTRVLVGIADVDALVPEGSAIDTLAGENTTSVYTGVEIFPMLPEALSTDRTSLLPGDDREAVVIEMRVDKAGNVVASDVYIALVRNHAQLTYDAVGAWLEGQAQVPENVAQTPGLEAQLRLQEQVANALHARRIAAGALEFETVEAQPVMANGQVVDLQVPLKNTARMIIENFMISANMTLANFLTAHGLVSIQRIVKQPERWPRIVALAAETGDVLPDQPDSHALSVFLARRKAADPAHFPDLSLAVVKLMGPGQYAAVQATDPPQGHFGLAAYRYTHSTAPNRRYADLITQRILKAALANAPAPYTLDALESIAAHCTERENAARKVERLMRKVSAAVLMRDHIGQVFTATITGASPKGVYARLAAPPVEGRVVQGDEGLDVGDTAHLRLIAVDPMHGFIDFARV